MKKTLLFVAMSFIFCNYSNAQVFCVLCFDQNDSVSYNVNNLILNGGMENSTCAPWPAGDRYCPNSAAYNCDITNWTCTGGGASTYACMMDSTYFHIVEGLRAAYFGNFFSQNCSATTGDTSCLTMSDCEAGGLPAGFPTNDPTYGGTTGISLEQTVNGLTPGAAYVLEFWAGGEWSFTDRGMFGVDVGFGNILLRDKPSTTNPLDQMTRFIILFVANSPSHTIKFTNWGHICNTCTELILDDVKLYTLAELNPSVNPCTVPVPIAVFNAPNHICPGTCTAFNNLSLNATSYLWSFTGATPNTSTDVNPTNICYNTPGAYPVSLIATSASGSDTLTLNNYITVYPYPAPQGISQSGDTLFANQGAVSYQWYHTGVLIPGATDYFYVAQGSGDFNVVCTDNNNCQVEAAIFDVVASVQSVRGSRQFAIYPNPAGNKLVVRSSEIGGKEILIYNLLGEKMMDVLPQTSTLKPETTLDVKALNPGMYMIEVLSAEKTMRSKFVKK